MNVSLKVKIFDNKGTHILQVAKSTLTIGSASHCDVVLDDPSINPEHARAWLEGGRIWIQDLGAVSGTSLNEIRLPALKPMLVRDLDVLRLGDSPSTLGLEAILVRAPVVKPKVKEPLPKENQVVESKGLSNVELEKRREEAETISRNLAELRLQLQMAKLEKISAEEMSQQLQDLRDEIKRVQEQKSRWDETLRQMEVDKLAMRKNIEKELLEFKAKALKDLKKASSDEAAAQVQALQGEIKKLTDQKDSLVASARLAESDKEAFRKTFEKEAAELKAKNIQVQALNESLRQVQAEKEALRLSLGKDAADNKAKSSKETGSHSVRELQKFETWKIDSVAELSTRLRALSLQKFKTWGTQPLSKDLIKEWDADLNQIFRRVLLNELEPAAPAQTSSIAASEREAESRSRRRREAQQSRLRWKTLAVTSVILIIVLAGVWFGSAYIKQHGNRSLSSVNTERPPVREKEPDIEKPSEKPLRHIEPKMGRKYRSSYTENVLYLENYVASEENQDFRKKWESELNKIAGNEWKIDSWIIGPLGRDEQLLVQDLNRIKEGTSPDREKEGIEKMHAREGKFMLELDGIFKSRSAVERFLKFKRSFYQRNQAFLTRSS